MTKTTNVTCNITIVHSATGRPIEGVQVTLTKDGSDFHKEGKTDRGGFVQFHHLGDGTYHVHPKKSGYNVVPGLGISPGTFSETRPDPNTHQGTMIHGIRNAAQRELEFTISDGFGPVSEVEKTILMDNPTKVTL